MSEIQFDEHTDVVVVGSGGGALVGALVAAQDGLDTIVIESTPASPPGSSSTRASTWPGSCASCRSAAPSRSPRCFWC
jgi:succinate dehydrogenase/fumarate reductase flavoprotein subunit